MSPSQESEPSSSQKLHVVSAPPPGAPLKESYTYHSPLPSTSGPYILGVDEAGRGPVLGPLVYGVAYCPVAWKEDLDELGFADSKTLSYEARAGLLDILSSHPENLGWSVRVISPQAISAGMLSRPPTNLNKQSENATILLIREVLQRGINVTEVYVDALGNTTTYEAYLSSLFPGISFTVRPKADALYKIVSAASIAAKVTRDACIENWVWEERHRKKQDEMDVDGEDEHSWGGEIGSGYPSDPKTVAWLDRVCDNVFGFPSIARFSWTTVKLKLDKGGTGVKWIDDGQDNLIKAFATATGHEKDRCVVTKDLALKSVGTL